MKCDFVGAGVIPSKTQRFHYHRLHMLEQELSKYTPSKRSALENSEGSGESSREEPPNEVAWVWG